MRQQRTASLTRRAFLFELARPETAPQLHDDVWALGCTSCRARLEIPGEELRARAGRQAACPLCSTLHVLPTPEPVVQQGYPGPMAAQPVERA